MQFHRSKTHSVSATFNIHARASLFCLLIGLSGLVTSQAQSMPAKNSAPSAEASDTSSVIATFNQMVEAAQKKDDQSLQKFNAANATYIDGSGISEGFTNLQAKAKARVGVNASHADINDFKVADVSARTVGDVAWVTYRYSLTAPVKGKATPIVGVATIIFQRFGDDWKVVHSQTAGRPRTAADNSF